MSQHLNSVLFGEQTHTCEWCENEYTIATSDAWEMQHYCSGDCEVLADSDELVPDEPIVFKYKCVYCGVRFETIDELQDHADYDCSKSRE